MNTDLMFSSATDKWNTPKDLIYAIVRFLGWIDLDPCADASESVPAGNHFTENGLEREWFGRVFMNPPYGREIGKWVMKARSEDGIDELIMLLPARTDTKWFQPLLTYNFSVCFINHRLKFGDSKNSAPFPSALVYRGSRHKEFYWFFEEWGAVV